MDPALPPARSIQTWLPASASGMDFAGRAGAFVAMGTRGMRSVNTKHRQFEPADAGPATVRTLRRPRPVALPGNGQDERAWRRTVASYAMKDLTCLAMAGAWDSIAAPLVELDGKQVSRWCLFVGKPQPFGLVIESRGSAPAWRGSVLVQCLMFDSAGAPLSRPAHRALGMLQAALDAKSLRCGLRVGSRVIDVTQIALPKKDDGTASEDTLVLSLGGGERITVGDCTLECGFVPQPDVPKGQVDSVVIAVLAQPRVTLASVKLRTLALPVRGPMQDRYPLPILRRTVFFADPAFDRKLSRVDPLSVNESFHKETPKEVFNAWIDRPSVTPNETAVVRVKTNMPDGPKSASARPNYELAAKVTRRGGGPPEDLLFQLEPGTPELLAVPLELNQFYALPTSSLRSRTKGALRSGDTLVLVVACKTAGTTIATARLMLPVRQRSSLPPPQAMYSLVTADVSRNAAWCAAHSPLPAPENMWTEVLNADTDKLLRRGLFKWVSYDRTTAALLAYSILKAEKATESTHIPQVLEPEMKLPEST